MKLKGDQRTIHLVMLEVFFAFLVWSFIKPHDYVAWIMEALPAMLIVGVLAVTYKKFRFTTFVYAVVLVHAIIMIIGSHYTYAENPLFDYFKQEFNLSRNHYDRVGHFAQGFGPAVIARELLFREGYVKKGKMFSFIIIAMCLGFSAFYELIEFGASVVSGVPGEVVLAFQGDFWDSQWDMIMALIGAMMAELVFGRIHDRFIIKIK